jgi:hypothetical protein
MNGGSRINFLEHQGMVHAAPSDNWLPLTDWHHSWRRWAQVQWYDDLAYHKSKSNVHVNWTIYVCYQPFFLFLVYHHIVTVIYVWSIVVPRNDLLRDPTTWKERTLIIVYKGKLLTLYYMKQLCNNCMQVNNKLVENEPSIEWTCHSVCLSPTIFAKQECLALHSERT